MAIRQLDEAVSILESTISEFPVGASAPDDFKPIEDKIISLRESLRALNARKLTMNALIDSEMSGELSEEELTRSMDCLNVNSTNYLINTNTLKLCYQSKAIQDIVYGNAGSPEIQERTKVCLNQLFALNDRLISKNEKKKELMKRQYQLRLDCHQAIYNHQDFINEREFRRNQQLEEMNPDVAQNKDKINKSIFKINTMKRLITNLIASMCKDLHENEDLIEMLNAHKEMINLETIVELTQGQSTASSDS